MCGIFGVVGTGDASRLILDGLRRLEYRGYDSSGIATVVDGVIDRRRAEGKLGNLEKVLKADPLPGTIGIGHIRWATHGAPTETNAHPHVSARVAVVHNGIIENFRELREEMEASGHAFESETDSEVIAHLVTDNLNAGLSPSDATGAALKRLEGAFALALIFTGEENLLIGARRGAPLAVGHGDGEMYLGSDALALGPVTKQVSYLEEGDRVELSSDGAIIRDENDVIVEREVKYTSVGTADMSKGNHEHYMAKEIFEQPAVIGDTLDTYFNPLSGSVALPALPFDLAAISKLTIIACGTSYYAAMVAKYWFEQIARVPVEVDVASEFRYREAAMPTGGLALFISQSGETADTLAALR
ncbi:MAG: glutamine--fructose-6-phosphate transaminase (isomerizing), partial [Rhodospirillales bacterium]|nr:glutamine--fructose-6-phosphate transaminase (isomerizing) [Rhodospirillales bacterium]